MPQARLPDINTAFIVYRREAITSLKSQNYDNCFGALYALNGLLPKDYRITISTQDYEKLANLELKAKCPKCDVQTDYKNITVREVLLSMIVRTVSERPNETVWQCPDCNAINTISETVMIEPILKEPYFLKVVPKPPERKDGLQSRSGYHRKMSQWVWTILDELESQMAQFRDDNWHKQGEEYDIDTEIDGGEENDAV